MGEVQASTMPEEFLNAVSATEIGSYSKVFKSDMGYHIVKVDDKKDQLEDLRTEIEQTLKSQKLIEYMKDLRANADVKKMDLPEIKDDDVKTKEEDKDAETKEDSKDTETNEDSKDTETNEDSEAEDKSENK